MLEKKRDISRNFKRYILLWLRSFWSERGIDGIPKKKIEQTKSRCRIKALLRTTAATARSNFLLQQLMW